jgi:hypothetical protein
MTDSPAQTGAGQAFMLIGRGLVLNIAQIFKTKTTKTKGKATGGGSAARLRQQRNRDDKRGAWLRRMVSAKATPPPPHAPERSPEPLTRRRSDRTPQTVQP